jgi:two-component system nitrate/nitrite response regulator NarL
MQQPKNILIADDHQIFLDGLFLIFSSIKEFSIVAQAHNGLEVMEQFSKHHIDIAILDINMPKVNGFETAKLIRDQYPACKIIILSMYSDEQFVNEFMRSGASAYVLKNAGKIELLNALQQASLGNTYISKELHKPYVQPTEKDAFSKAMSLTKREMEIIKLLAQEKSSQEIADQLFLSIYTINTHRKNILQKLGIKNAAGLVRFASDNELL